MTQHSHNEIGVDEEREHENSFWEKQFSEELAKIKEGKWKEYSSAWWEEYYAAMKASVSPLIENIKDPGILEPGSGSGKASIILGKAYQRTLLDISEKALEYARFLAKRFEVENLEYVQGDIFDMPFADKEFDLVWNIGVVEHYSKENLHKAISEMIRTTKEGGYVAIGIPNKFSGPIMKARLLNLKILSIIPGYRLGSENFYSPRDMQAAVKIAAASRGREVELQDSVRIGNPLPMETPRVILKTLGRAVYQLFPRNRFLHITIAKVQ